MVSIASRASWGARHPDGDGTVLTGLAVEVFMHHDAGLLLPASATVAQERARMRALEQTGQDRFRAGISYNVVVFPSGRAYQGVSWNRRGTHTGGRNSTSRSIALAGNFETHHPTAAAIATARAIFHHGRGRWWTQGAPLRGHRDVSATLCPGRHITSRMAEIRRPITPTPPPVPPTPPPPSILGATMFTISCDVPDHPQRGTWWVVIPTGGRPRATVLGAQDQRTGIPHLAFRWANSWDRFRAGVDFP